METVKLVLGGDVMLGRNVGEWIRRRGPDYPLGKIHEVMAGADLVMVNLECAITASTTLWSGSPKAFYFGAPVEAADALLMAGVDVVSLANNHVLDFDYEGLDDTLDVLKDAGIAYVGAGRNITEASSAVFFERNGISFGMTAYCDHQEDFCATKDTAGINYIDLSDEKAVLSRFRADLDGMGKIDWPILSIHWGPNMVESPSSHFRTLARGAVDMGFGMIFGHSAHVFQGVEIHEGRPIFYGCGDLVDDYLVDPRFANDHQLLFELEVSRKSFEKIRFHPIFVESCMALPAAGRHRDFVIERITRLCREMGTAVLADAGLASIVR